MEMTLCVEFNLEFKKDKIKYFTERTLFSFFIFFTLKKSDLLQKRKRKRDTCLVTGV